MRALAYSKLAPSIWWEIQNCAVVRLGCRSCPQTRPILREKNCFDFHKTWWDLCTHHNLRVSMFFYEIIPNRKSAFLDLITREVTQIKHMCKLSVGGLHCPASGKDINTDITAVISTLCWSSHTHTNYLDSLILYVVLLFKSQSALNRIEMCQSLNCFHW